ncbi:MAG: response regulator [Leptospiraceae bacterium]|nr:response regulator [Leptospiraceae bacterium]
MNHKILFLGDEEVSILIAGKILENLNLEYSVSRSMQEALISCRKEEYSLILVDLNLAGSDSIQLIEYLSHQSARSEIIVLTSDRSARSILPLLKLGISDFILKPFQKSDFIQKVKRALSLAENYSNIYRSESDDHSAESTAVCDNTYYRFVSHLHTILNQGSGFGSMISLIKLMQSSAIQDADFIKLPAAFFPILQQNARTGEKILGALQEIHKLQTSALEMREFDWQEFTSMLTSLQESNSEVLKIRAHILEINNKVSENAGIFMYGNPSLIETCFDEIILNGARFSKPGSQITFAISMHNDVIQVEIQNTVTEEHAKLPAMCKNPIEETFEPFSRLTVSLMEEYSAMESGLGLTKVRQVMIKHGGAISLNFNVQDQIMSTTLQFPLFKN